MGEETEILLDGLDESNITSVLTKHIELREIQKQIATIQESLIANVEEYLLSRKWKSYYDEDSKINISITKHEKKIIDTKQLKLILTPSQLVQAVKLKPYTQVNILTKKDMRGMDKYVKPKK